MVKRLLREAMLMGVVLVLMFVGPAWAQAPAQQEVLPGAVEKSLQPAPEVKVAPLPEIIIQEESDKPLLDSGVTLDLNDVKFDEGLIFSPEQLKAVVANYVGTTITVGELSKLTAAVTAFYREKGYFLTRAYLPPQTIKDGVVAIAVREGRLGNIIIKGNQRYSRDLIRNTLKIIRGEGAIRTDDVERALLLLMDNPGLTVKVTFKPGDRPGASDIVLEATEAFPINLQIDYDNFGSRYVSEHRGGIGVRVNNPLGFGDSLSLRGVSGFSSEGLLYGRGEYVAPLGYSGLRFGVAYSYMKYNMGRELSILNAGGTSQGGSLWLNYPIIRSRNVNWYIEGGVDAKDVAQSLFNQEIAKDKIRQARIGTTVQWLDTLNGSNTIALKAYQGFAGILSGMDQNYTGTIRSNTDIIYNKIEADVSRVQAFPYNFYLLINGSGMYSAQRLPSSEQFHMGGMGSVRGYAAGEFSGDSGVVAQAELRIPILGASLAKYVQLAGFYDCGWLWVSKPLVGERSLDGTRLQGAGAGLRFAYSPYLHVKVDWAQSFDSQPPRNIEDKNNGIWYFQATLSF